MTTTEYHSVVINDELVYPKKISLKHSISKIIVLSFMIMQTMTVIIHSEYVKNWIYNIILKDIKIRETVQKVYNIIYLICTILIFIVSCFMLYDTIFPSNRLHGIYDHKQLQSKAQCDNIIASITNGDSDMLWYRKIIHRMKTYHRLDNVLIEHLNIVYEQYIKMIGKIFQKLETIDDKLDAFMKRQNIWNVDAMNRFDELEKQIQSMDDKFEKRMQSMDDKFEKRMQESFDKMMQTMNDKFDEHSKQMQERVDKMIQERFDKMMQTMNDKLEQLIIHKA